MEISMIIWGLVFAVAVIAEIATLQLVSIWFAAGALTAFIGAACGLEFLPEYPPIFRLYHRGYRRRYQFPCF